MSVCSDNVTLFDDMPQHFLLSDKARTLSLKAIYAAGDDKAYETFCNLRW